MIVLLLGDTNAVITLGLASRGTGCRAISTSLSLAGHDPRRRCRSHTRYQTCHHGEMKHSQDSTAVACCSYCRSYLYHLQPSQGIGREHIHDTRVLELCDHLKSEELPILFPTLRLHYGGLTQIRILRSQGGVFLIGLIKMDRS
jgi:hypothetical protein